MTVNHPDALGLLVALLGRTSVELTSLDNPGWSLQVGAPGPDLDHTLEEQDEAIWLAWSRAEDKARVAGGAAQLPAVVARAAQLAGVVEGGLDELAARRTVLHALAEWYGSQCDGDWEHQHLVRLAGGGSRFVLQIDVVETELDDIPVDDVVIDGLAYRSDGVRFTVEGDGDRLDVGLRAFVDLSALHDL